MERKCRRAWAKFLAATAAQAWIAGQTGGEKRANGKSAMPIRPGKGTCRCAEISQTREVLTGFGLGRWRSKLKAWLCVLWQFCMGEEEGDFGRGGETPWLVFYYGRLIE